MDYHVAVKWIMRAGLSKQITLKHLDCQKKKKKELKQYILNKSNMYYITRV